MSFDAPAENKAFADKYGFKFPLLCDTSREVGLAYGATDAGAVGRGNARRVGVVIGPDGRVKEWSPKVDARAFPREVLARI